MSLKKTVRDRCSDRLVLGLFFLYAFHFVYAQETGLFRWSLDGDLRYRFESWDNANALSYGNPPEYGQPDDKILLQRIIAGTTIHSGRHLTISAHVQDARAFGWSLANAREPYAFSVSPEGQPEAGYKMNPQEEFFEVHDLYITVGKLWQHLSVTAGRQKIALGDYRIFGPGTWGNTGRWTWDALRLTFSPERWSLNAWVGGTKIHDPVRTSFPFTHTEYLGGGIHSVISLLPRTKLDAMFAYKRQGSVPYIRDQDINRNWTGLRFYQTGDSPLIADFAVYLERGRQNGTAKKAFGLVGALGGSLTAGKGRAGGFIRYSHASGNKPETTVNEQFDPAFGASDRYYGWMNLVKWSNLADQEAMLFYRMGKQFALEISFHRFFIPQEKNIFINGRLFLPEGSNHLANELDIMLQYQPSNAWTFDARLGYFMVKDARTAASESPGNALWMAVQVNYIFNRLITNKT